MSIRATAVPFGEAGGTIGEGSGAVDGRPDGRLVFVSNLNELGAPAGANGENFALPGSVQFDFGLPTVRRGLFALLPQSPNALTLAITQGGAPGTTGGFTGQIDGLNIDQLNDVVFSGAWEKITNPTASGTGIWWSDSGISAFTPPTPVALSGTPAPGTGQNFGGMNAGTLYNTLQYIGFISGGLGNWTYQKSNGQLRRVSYTGMPVEVFGAGLTLSNAGQVLGLANSGRFLILGQTNAGNASAKSHLFLASAPDAITPIFSTGDPAPGLAGRTIGTMGASLNVAGDVAVMVLLDDGDTNQFNNTSALYFYRASAGELDLVTHGGAPLAGLPTGIWGGTPLVNSNRLLFLPGLGFIDPYGGPGSTAVFEAIPAIPTTFDVPVAFGFSFNDLGQVVAYVQETSNSFHSLWFNDPGAGWQKLARRGEAFGPSGSANPVVKVGYRSDSSGSDGKPTGLTNDGRVVFTVDGRYLVVARKTKPNYAASTGTTDVPVGVKDVGTLDASGTGTINVPDEVETVEVVNQTGGTINITGDVNVINDFIFIDGNQGGTGATAIYGTGTLGGVVNIITRKISFLGPVDGSFEMTLKDGARFEIGAGNRWDVTASATWRHGDESAAAFENNGTITNGEPGDAPGASTMTIDTPFTQDESGLMENHRTILFGGDVDIRGTFANDGFADFMGWRAFWQGLIDEAINRGTIRIGYDELGRETIIFNNLDNQGTDARMEINDADARIEFARPDYLKRLDLKAGAKFELHRADGVTGTEPLLETDEASITGPGNELHFETPGAAGDNLWRVNSSFQFNAGSGGSAAALKLQNVDYVAATGSTTTNLTDILIQLLLSRFRNKGSWVLGGDVQVDLLDEQSCFESSGDVVIPTGRLLGIRDVLNARGVFGAYGRLELAGEIAAILRMRGRATPLYYSELHPGSSPGKGIVNGEVVLGPFSKLVCELGGTQQGVTYDHLDVNGAFTIDSGLIDVRFVNGFEATVAPGDVFVLVEADAPIAAPFANLPSGARRNTSDGLRSFELHYGEGSAHGANRVVATNFGAAVTGPPPAISSQPITQVVVVGGTATFSVAATGAGPFTYQWLRNGVPIARATDASYSVSDVQPGQGGSYSVVVSNATGSVTSSVGTFSLDTTPRLINVSCLASAGVGDSTLVAGFYINGTGSKELLIRGVGPTLAAAPYNRPGMIADPQISVYDKGGLLIASNDDWDPILAADFSRMGAFGLVNGSKDAALKITLPGPDRYTVHLVNTGPVADGLIEVYDLSRDLPTRLSNVSCRIDLKANETVILGTALIANPVPVLARAIGPGLADYGIPLADTLPDPDVRVYAGSTEIAFNEDWNISMDPYFDAAGSFPLPAGSKDAATRVTFTQGSLTIHATGKGQTGIAIIELFESPEPN